MTLAKCSVCGQITDTWDRYGSLFLEDEYPQECIYVCSAQCLETAESKINSGEWNTPKLKKAFGGYMHDISKPKKGYETQPSQDDLIRELLKKQP
jgi:hypothetical protein